MNQRINLLSSLPPLPPRNFSGRHILFLWGAVCVLLFSIYLVNYAGYVVQTQKIKQLQTREARLLSKFERMTKSPSGLVSEKLLQRRVTKLSKDIQEKMHLVRVLSDSPYVYGFSVYLQLIAHHIPSGVWLQHMQFKPSQGLVSLKGKSLAAALIPQFEKNLQQETIFRGKNFHVKLEKDTQQSIFLFELTNETTHES